MRKGGTTAQYTYNAEGIRTAKTVNGERTTFILDGANVIGEVNAQNQVTNYIRGASGVILSKDPSNVMKYYVTNGHGDVMGLTDTTGAVVKSYEYDAFGQEYSPSSGDTNPFRYCGEYFDSETQSIYLRARYYSPASGRFTQQDPARDGLNWYVYCSSNPVNSVDPTGLIPWEEASEIIKRNAQTIINAGEYYGVNPAIIASCIYTELTLNVNWVDDLTDFPFYWADTSIGIGQVKVSTAKMLEDEKYIAPTKYNRTEVYNRVKVNFYDAPGVGEVIADSREAAIAYRLTSESENINYVAAYLKYWQDRWKDAYPEIDGRTAVLATLYNQGETYPPHSNPKPNEFGEQAKKEYEYMKELLGLD